MGQNSLVKIGRAIAEILIKKFGLKSFWSTRTMTQKELGPNSLVKIDRVIAEILLIWINVTRAYFAWTNVIMSVSIF